MNWTRNWTREELDSVLKANPALSIAGEKTIQQASTLSGDNGRDNLASKTARPTTSKMHNIRTGHYQSKREAKNTDELELRKQAGEIDFYLEQVPFLLPGIYTDKRGRQRRVRHYLDKITFKHVAGDLWKIEWIECKGRDLPMGKLKRMQCEELYKISIQVV